MPLYLTLTNRHRKIRKATKKYKVGDIAPPKKYYINFNKVKPLRYQEYSNLKNKYEEIAIKMIKGIKMSTPIRLTFVHYYPDLRQRDRANACCIHEKFFCDALTAAKCIPDDNDKHIVETIYRSGGLDRKNPRMEIIIEEI